MHHLWTKSKLEKDSLKDIAKLMYQDVSPDVWDQAYLTKRNLDFSIESVRIIDTYVERLRTKHVELFNQYKEHFVLRIGAYIGEVIRLHKAGDFKWYTFASVAAHVDGQLDTRAGKNDSVLYMKHADVVIQPVFEVDCFFNGQSVYPSLLAYVEAVRG